MTGNVWAMSSAPKKSLIFEICTKPKLCFLLIFLFAKMKFWRPRKYTTAFGFSTKLSIAYSLVLCIGFIPSLRTKVTFLYSVKSLFVLGHFLWLLFSTYLSSFFHLILIQVAVEVEEFSTVLQY